jgi:hypothetical protein
MADAAREPLTTKITRSHFSYAAVVEVQIGDDRLASWCLELSLLSTGLAEVAFLSDGAFTISITLDEELHPHTRGRAVWSDDALALVLTRNELDYWMHFFLRYYRDGAADVPYIDMDLSEDRTNLDREVHIEFKCESVKPPTHTGSLEELLFPEEQSD